MRTNRKHLGMIVLGMWAFLLSFSLAHGLQEDLKARRDRLKDLLGPETMLIAWSAPTRLYSRDIEYEYRQDSNLYYLTGITQPETTLILMPGNRTRQEILFVRQPDARREHRQGHTLTRAEASQVSGIETVYLRHQFESFVGALFNRRPYSVPRRVKTPEYDVFFSALGQGKARLALLLGPAPQLSEELTAPYAFAKRVRDRYLQAKIIDAGPLLARLRQVKTPYEQTVLEKSVAISARAHRAGMAAAAPGKYEYQVEAAIERVYLGNGAMSWGYPSIVGSGPNATILHYNTSQRRMVEGDLLLVDAAANYQGLTGDITRTYPVNGKFSPLQRDLYSLVLSAQKAGMKAAKSGNKTSDIEKAAEEVIKSGLLERHLITDSGGDQFRTWYTHGICHWIGMDVHDVGDYDRPLGPGMAFVIEPGLYIREQALDDLSDTPKNRAFAQAVRPAVIKYKNLGIRIEDSFLLTEQGLKRLSAGVPRTVEEIESFMQSRSQTTTQ